MQVLVGMYGEAPGNSRKMQKSIIPWRNSAALQVRVLFPSTCREQGKGGQHLILAQEEKVLSEQIQLSLELPISQESVSPTVTQAKKIEGISAIVFPGVKEHPAANS